MALARQQKDPVSTHFGKRHRPGPKNLQAVTGPKSGLQEPKCTCQPPGAGQANDLGHQFLGSPGCLEAHSDSFGSITNRCLTQKRNPEEVARPGRSIKNLGSRLYFRGGRDCCKEGQS